MLRWLRLYIHQGEFVLASITKPIHKQNHGFETKKIKWRMVGSTDFREIQRIYPKGWNINNLTFQKWDAIWNSNIPRVSFLKALK